MTVSCRLRTGKEGVLSSLGPFYRRNFPLLTREAVLTECPVQGSDGVQLVVGAVPISIYDLATVSVCPGTATANNVEVTYLVSRVLIAQLLRMVARIH